MSTGMAEQRVEGAERPGERPASRSPRFSDLAPSHRYAAIIVAMASGASVLAHFGLGARGLISVGFVAVLKAAAAGLPNRDIGQRLWVTEHTVKFHLTNIFRKLDVANRTEAARWAHQHGLIQEVASEPVAHEAQAV